MRLAGSAASGSRVMHATTGSSDQQTVQRQRLRDPQAFSKLAAPAARCIVDCHGKWSALVGHPPAGCRAGTTLLTCWYTWKHQSTKHVPYLEAAAAALDWVSTFAVPAAAARLVCCLASAEPVAAVKPSKKKDKKGKKDMSSLFAALGEDGDAPAGAPGCLAFAIHQQD